MFPLRMNFLQPSRKGWFYNSVPYCVYGFVCPYDASWSLGMYHMGKVLEAYRPDLCTEIGVFAAHASKQDFDYHPLTFNGVLIISILVDWLQC